VTGHGHVQTLATAGRASPAAARIASRPLGTALASALTVPSILERAASPRSLVAGLLPLALATGCEPSVEACQVERVASAIVRGHAHTDYLGLAEAEARAIVTLDLLRAGEVRDLCSGVAVTSELVLTAAHCLDESVVALSVAGRSWERWGDEPLSIETAPERDMAVVRLPGLAAATALAPSDEEATRWAGALVELAGAGRREDGSAGSVQFAVAEVLAVDERYLVVQLPQAGGPCAGDSGGPLLVRGPSGRLEVAGVLSSGAPSCEGPDYYERLDAASEWLAQRRGELPAGSDACGSLTERGRCFGRRAVWCERREVRARDCLATEVCGYSLDSRGFRCVDRASDPCGGVPDNGRCVDGDAVRCVDGHLERLPCEACAGACAISSRNGSAVCALSTASPP